MLENILSGISLQPENIPNWLVVVMGMGTVFIGLICIIIICKIVSLFFVNKADEPVAAATPAAPAATVNTVIENRQEIIAAVTAVIAEEMGTDVNALRVISFKKI
ncbi:MAG: OadG family protein [Clostridia bacterium]|nr:OadG family protein [Clostridia bacterium]